MAEKLKTMTELFSLEICQDANTLTPGLSLCTDQTKNGFGIGVLMTFNWGANSTVIRYHQIIFNVFGGIIIAMRYYDNTTDKWTDWETYK